LVWAKTYRRHHHGDTHPDKNLFHFKSPLIAEKQRGIWQSNARHHPPRIQRIKHGVLRMKLMLFAVGCMAL